MPAPSSPVTAVVRAKNSGRTLRRCLESIQKQTHAPAEIILVDSGSTDDTLQIAAAFGCRILHYPKGQAFNYSKALNIGFAVAETPYVLCFSSHSEFLRTDSLEAMVRNLEFFGACCAYCNHQQDAFATPQDPSCLVETIYLHNFDGFNGLQSPCGLVRRDLWQTHPFDEALPSAEDNDWALWHFKEKHMCSVALTNHPTGYHNPYKNHQKLIRDTLVVANYIHPKVRSFRSIAWFLLHGVNEYLGANFDRGILYHRIALALTLNRFVRQVPRASTYHRAHATV